MARTIVSEEDIYLVINERRHDVHLVKISYDDEECLKEADRRNESKYHEGMHWVIKARVITRTENND